MPILNITLKLGHYLSGRSFRRTSFARLQLPEHVYDQPFAVPPGEVEVIHPVGGDDLRACRALIDIQDRDIRLAPIWLSTLFWVFGSVCTTRLASSG